ncbi:MAG: hypothetical protein K8R86_09670 [Bacteroidales bacterium]|nr:hypothetical protein [Bacteroidales bacterium]
MEPQTKIIDFTFLEGFTKGNTDKMVYFINMYLKTAPSLFNELLNFSIEKSWEEVCSKAHYLKPQVQYIGVVGLKDILAEIEQIAKEGKDKSSLNELAFEAVKLNNQGIAELENFITSNSYQ